MILVTGTIGFIGQKLMECCGNTIAGPSLRDKTEEEIRRIVEESGADTDIHFSDIGLCQNNPEASYIANVQIHVALSKAAENVCEELWNAGVR